MKVEKNIILNKLYDAYGQLLSEGQKEIMSAHLNYDLTVSEIAENMQISRQAVKDSVNKAEKKLFEFEERLGFVKRLELLEQEIEMLKNKLSKKEED